MLTIITRRAVAGAALLAIAACGGAAATSSSNSSGAANPTSQGSSSSATITSGTVSGHGAVLTAGSNGMTLYQFSKDTPGSGTSACLGGCISTWPPLTVPPGTSPTAGSGLSGQLGTIKRTDGKGTQVTYKGLPLYFYSGDTKPGDGNGNYPGWASVPAASGAAAPATSAPSSAAASPSGY